MRGRGGMCICTVQYVSMCACVYMGVCWSVCVCVCVCVCVSVCVFKMSCLCDVMWDCCFPPWIRAAQPPSGLTHNIEGRAQRRNDELSLAHSLFSFFLFFLLLFLT